MPAIENKLQGMSTCWCSRIVGVARLLFKSGDYFIQHFRRCGDYSRAASDRANTVNQISKFMKKENLNFSDPHEPPEESSIETLHCDASDLTT